MDSLSNVEVTLRRREGATERCPYCHDYLEGGVLEDVQVVCEGCGTAHHRACLAELGGCTVMGCGDGKPAAVGGVEEVRSRVRERVGRFVATHTERPAPVRSRVADFDRVRAILRERGLEPGSVTGPRRPRADFSRLGPGDWLGLLLLGAGVFVIWGFVLVG